MKYILIPALKLIYVIACLTLAYPVIATVLFICCLWDFKFKERFRHLIEMQFGGSYNDRHELIGYYKNPIDYLFNKVTPIQPQNKPKDGEDTIK